MSGLLRRLVDGAAGRGQPPVRSASRSAFAGAPSLLPQDPDVDGLPDGLQLPQPLQAPALSMRAPAAPARDWGDPQTSTAPALALADESARHSARRGSMPFASPSSDARDQAGRITTSRPEMQQAQLRAAGDAVSDESWLTRAPTPLMPPPLRAEALATGAVRSVTATPPAASGSRSGEANEVHVTIGRIEITAVHEAAPPRRTGKTGKPLTSLDDYLRQRQRGG